MPNTNIKKEIKSLGLKLAELPEVITLEIAEHDANYAKWSADFTRYSKSPDDFDQAEVSALREQENELDAKEDDIIAQLKQHKEDLDAALAQRKKEEQEEADRKKAQDEADQKRAQEEADRKKAQEEEEERIRLENEQKQKSSGSLGKGLFIGSVLFVLTLGAINLFKNK